MISRRKFTVGLGASAILSVVGCSGPVKNASQGILDVLSLFSSSPVVKILEFLKIINNTISDLYKVEENSEYIKVRFDTLNPGVNGAIVLSKVTPEEIFDDGFCDFEMPKNGTVRFSPAQFLDVNDLSISNDAELTSLDDSMILLMRECSREALDTGEGNLFKLIDLRLACFEREGYKKIHIDYFNIKHQRYEV